MLVRPPTVIMIDRSQTVLLNYPLYHGAKAIVDVKHRVIWCRPQGRDVNARKYEYRQQDVQVNGAGRRGLCRMDMDRRLSGIHRLTSRAVLLAPLTFEACSVDI